MKTWRRRLLDRLPLLGLSWTGLGPGTGVVSRRDSRTRVQALSDGAWLVQCPTPGQRPLTVRQVGPPAQRAHLVLDRPAARRGMRGHQRSLGNYLAEEHTAWLLRELEINCVIDVGGNVGQFGKRLRRAGYTGRIVSFEPLPHTAEKLRRAAEGDADWQVVECALGEEETKEEMTVVGGKGATSSLLPVSEFGKEWSPRLEGVGKQSVVVRRLDGLFDEITAGIPRPRVYLKLDTQGYDVKAFKGAGDRLQDILGMQSEVSNLPIYEDMPRFPEQVSVYEAEGFEATGFFPVSRDSKTLRVVEFDVFMVRAGGPSHQA